MNKWDMMSITQPPQPLHQLKTPPLTEEAKEVMVRHGCTLKEHPNECIIFFPEGTTKTEMLLRTMNPRYQIKLPDGYELREVYDKYREISMLSYTRE